MRSSLKKITVWFVLIPFLMVVFFSLPLMIHGSNDKINDNCLFSIMELNPCPQDNIASIAHHFSFYESFLNVPINFGVMVLIISLLFVTYIISIFSTNLLFLKLPIYSSNSNSPPPNILHKIKIMRWFSLFENSPNFE